MNDDLHAKLCQLDGVAVANVNEPSPGDLERVLQQNRKLREEVENLKLSGRRINPVILERDRLRIELNHANLERQQAFELLKLRERQLERAIEFINTEVFFQEDEECVRKKLTVLLKDIEEMGK